MDFNYLSVHQDELLEFLRANDYAETYVQRYRTTIKQITDNADDQNWASYADVYQWYVDAGHKPTYLKELKAILGKLEHFNLTGAFPLKRGAKSSFWKVKPAYSKLNPEYKDLYDTFESLCCSGLKDSTVSSYKTKIPSFLYDLQCKGLNTLSSVTEEDVLKCFADEASQKRSGTVCMKIARFFRVLSEAGNEQAARILGFIPQMRILLILLCQLLFLQGRACSENGSQRRTNIMGNRPKQVGVHLFPIHFKTQLLLPLDLGCQGADQDGDDEHDGYGQRITRIIHIKSPERVCKEIIDAERSHQGRGNSPGIPFCDPGNQDHRQNKHSHGKGIVVVIDR